MQFAVPQFIEVESKVIGPISVRQFIILLVSAGLAFLLYEILSLALFIVPGIIVVGFGIVLAFVKINSQPFHVFLLSIVQTLKQPRLSVWQHVTMKYTQKTGRQKKGDNTDTTAKPELTSSRLAELSLMVDSEGKYASNDINHVYHGHR
ncbi:MAG: PrgI family protein [Patescibacteria group bacterium]|jgi:hypothetical protein